MNQYVPYDDAVTIQHLQTSRQHYLSLFEHAEHQEMKIIAD